jgi:hypothetical protein
MLPQGTDVFLNGFNVGFKALLGRLGLGDLLIRLGIVDHDMGLTIVIALLEREGANMDTVFALLGVVNLLAILKVGRPSAPTLVGFALVLCLLAFLRGGHLAPSLGGL